ncbi:glyoxalase [Nocardia sp. NBC_00508]|uniref:glyoxalase n=1 Tax=Nocardia sp. NBC_00508 TaxID=2975992 RepID=UPI002E807FDF|nr:glyoxalase [Nocardia sp. NBC_00508]WUD65689.1 glyoxalase [Nocardia sp. NBC_00508]
MSDTAVPQLWTGDLAGTLDFYKTLGYTVTYEQTRPYVYGAVEDHGCALHFTPTPMDTDIPTERTGCLVMVDDAASRHQAFTTALRARYGKVPAKGLPRITRFRPGQSRFTVVDPAGNQLIYVQRDEPMKVEYGGSEALDGLAKVLDNARILRDFKTDYKAAFRVLEVGLGRFRLEAPRLDVARALGALAELAVATDDPDHAARFHAELRAMRLSDAERAAVADELRASDDLAAWLSET